MLNLKPRVADVKAIVKMLEAGEHETAEGLAEAILEQAYLTLQERGRYTVVGQLRYTKRGGYIDHDDARASKVCLGLFATEGDARRAAESLFTSSATGEEFRTWVLPVEHKTPSEVYADRKEAHRERSAWEKQKEAS